MQDAFPVAHVLRAQRGVESIEMARFCDLDGRRAFAEDLRDGVSGNEMNEQEDGGDDQPDHGQGVEDALEEGFQRSVLSGWWSVFSSLAERARRHSRSRQSRGIPGFP